MLHPAQEAKQPVISQEYRKYLLKVQEIQSIGYSLKDAMDLAKCDNHTEEQMSQKGQDEDSDYSSPHSSILDESDQCSESDFRLGKCFPEEKEQIIDYSVEEMPYVRYTDVISVINKQLDIVPADVNKPMPCSSAEVMSPTKKNLRSLPLGGGVENALKLYNEKLRQRHCVSLHRLVED